jgi:hypothetical protein
MNKALRGAELVARWRNSAELDNPAGPLFTEEFAESEIMVVNATMTCTTRRCDDCSDSCRLPCP